jgi:NAD(P)-dependent dehydrogenase (short-subunit alcohol dehydrogenase family)
MCPLLKDEGRREGFWCVKQGKSYRGATTFHKMTLDQWNAVINTNLGSLFNVTRQ